jgi:hypothetical protein
MTAIVEVDDFLEHYGVKGMKWGVIRDREELARQRLGKKLEPYSRKNRSKGVDARADRIQSKIDDIESGKTKVYNQRGRIKDLSNQRDVERARAKAMRDGKLTPGQKKALIGAAAVGVMIAAYGGYKMADLGIISQVAQQGKGAIIGDDKIWKKDIGLAIPMTPDDIRREIVPEINPDYGEIGTKMNCRRATMAYEMRRRGYDVRATRTVSGAGQTAGGLIRATKKGVDDIPTTPLGIVKRLAEEVNEGGANARKKPGKTNLTRLLDDTTPLGDRLITFTQHKEAEGIFSRLATQPNGSRGELGIEWSNGGGHSIAWEIINGQPMIIDAQSGETFETASEFQKYASKITNAGFTRLDDKDLNNDYLTRWLTNA